MQARKRVMNTAVPMPQMGREISEATVLELLVEVGQAVAEGELIEMETEKATAEVEAPGAGYALAFEVSVGDVVPVGAVLARIGDSADEPRFDADPADRNGGASSANRGR